MHKTVEDQVLVSWDKAPTPTAHLEDWLALQALPPAEWQLLLLGARKAAKLEDLSKRECDDLFSQARLAGLNVTAVLQTNVPTPQARGMASGDTPELFTLFAATGPEALMELVEADVKIRQGSAGRGDAILRSGQLLGYPECCCRFFSHLETQDDARVLDAYRNAGWGGTSLPQRSVPAALNFFPPTGGPMNWYPCSPDCQASIELVARHLRVLDVDWAEILTGAFSGLTIAFDRYRFLHLVGARTQGSWLHFDEVCDALSFTSNRRFTDSPLLRDFRNSVTSRFAALCAIRMEPGAVCGLTETGAGFRGLWVREPYMFLFGRSARCH